MCNYRTLFVMNSVESTSLESLREAERQADDSLKNAIRQASRFLQLAQDLAAKVREIESRRSETSRHH